MDLSTPPRRARLGLAFWLALAALLGLSGSVVAAWGPNTFSADSEAALLNRTNSDRVSAGLSVLKLDPVLAAVARWRSEDMIKRNYFNHNIPLPPGGVVFDELNRRHYCYALAGENIGWNVVDGPEATTAIETAFLKSKEHLDNIMGKSWTNIGIGAYRAANGRQMWTVLFAKACPAGSSLPEITPLPSSQPVIPTMEPLPTPGASFADPSPAVSPIAVASPSDNPTGSSEPSASPTAGPTVVPTGSGQVGSPTPNDSGNSGGGSPLLLLLILGAAGVAGAIFTLRRR